MKQCTSDKARRYNYSMASPFNEDEIEVADILLDLPNLIPQSEARRRGELPVSWVIKKKRSVPSVREVVETEEIIRPRVKVESTSPSTPLCFYPSESDEKSKHPLKINLKKRTREELLEMIDGLTRIREVLRGEVKNERSHCKKLKSLNLELKAKKLEASSFILNKEKPKLGIMGKDSLNLELKLDQQHYQNPMFANHQQQQLNISHSIYESQASGRFKFPNHGQVPQFLSSNGGGLSRTVNHVGPVGIPDLNVGLEEVYGLDSFQPLDRSRVFVDDRVMFAAEARRRRMIKVKEMKKQQQQQRVR